MKPSGLADEVARAAVFLVSDDSFATILRVVRGSLHSLLRVGCRYPAERRHTRAHGQRPAICRCALANTSVACPQCSLQGVAPQDQGRRVWWEDQCAGIAAAFLVLLSAAARTGVVAADLGSILHHRCVE
jgi:hypothetical protein